MLIKVSALHVYAHQDDDCDAIENCEICDIALESQSSGLEIPLQLICSNGNSILEIKGFKEKSQVFSSASNTFRLFGRPPPSL
ncbi:hypothetical protein LV716_17070 [Flagellimonas sp. HMM57]|uniref:hypothetical protein n=1 Tax=unclassified Flagellimonas TaxID=2644544 RepID=UPI0013D7787E|nr:MULTISPECIES: hypothetical protein [unclassified Flagellimonas]UII75954.1 hypothetical protein LV716_17070 [Flagellimonas sp. HMM57]